MCREWPDSFPTIVASINILLDIAVVTHYARINQISAAFAIDGFDNSHQILLEPIRYRIY